LEEFGPSSNLKTAGVLRHPMESNPVLEKGRDRSKLSLLFDGKDFKDAFGSPGIEPRWTRGNKEGVGTAYSADSKVWFTLWRGTLTEVYYPTVDRPQMRDMEFLVTDGKSFFHEEKRHLHSKVRRLSHHVLGYDITNSDPLGRYEIHKEVISDPHLPCILQHVRVTGEPDFLSKVQLFALCAPHLGGGGMGNNAYVVEFGGRRFFTAEKDGFWITMCATVPFARLSCGYVGMSDGWTDLARDMKMDWEFDRALDGNVAFTGLLDLSGSREFTLAISFGTSFRNAVATLFQSCAIPFKEHKERFQEQWDRPFSKILHLEDASGDGGDLYHSSISLMLAHEDKTFPGAFIASLSIPWGESKGDEDRGGYHLVWTRDMVNVATALLAAGYRDTPLRALIYLSVTQEEDGGFAQNFWIDGEPYWGGMQLDETAFPIILAYRLRKEASLKNFDPYPMVLNAASYLVKNGPATQQERWEELSGYSPSTLASNIAALICAAQFCKERGDVATAKFLEEYSDFLESHIEKWTVTTEGTLVPGITRHFIRIKPVDISDPSPDEDPNTGTVSISNIEPGHQHVFPAKEVVDAGFLELVRYGIRKADDPVIVDSLKVVDKVLKVDTPLGPVWHRYNHDGYGQREDGGAYEGWGVGRAWPLLTGERGHYELAAGHDPKPFVKAIEAFASTAGLIPEQVWDEPDRDYSHMKFGGPTGSATPLMWAHAEYVKLLRSVNDGKVFDLIPEVCSRYIEDRSRCRNIEVWKRNRQVKSMKKGWVLRVIADRPFLLHWSRDGWKTVKETTSTSTLLGVDYVDIPTSTKRKDRIVFTFLWKNENRWEGKDYQVNVE
jgi:glucoamylase